jgi:hypothetical protein
VNSTRGRGRPKKPRTVRVQVLLYQDQKERLDFLSSTLPGSPPLTGLVRDAVRDYLHKQFTESEEKAFRAHQELDLKIVR